MEPTESDRNRGVALQHQVANNTLAPAAAAMDLLQKSSGNSNVDKAIEVLHSASQRQGEACTACGCQRHGTRGKKKKKKGPGLGGEWESAGKESLPAATDPMCQPH